MFIAKPTFESANSPFREVIAATAHAAGFGASSRFVAQRGVNPGYTERSDHVV